jgi:hypothetical protein
MKNLILIFLMLFAAINTFAQEKSNDDPFKLTLSLSETLAIKFYCFEQRRMKLDSEEYRERRLFKIRVKLADFQDENPGVDVIPLLEQLKNDAIKSFHLELLEEISEYLDSLRIIQNEIPILVGIKESKKSMKNILIEFLKSKESVETVLGRYSLELNTNEVDIASVEVKNFNCAYSDSKNEEASIIYTTIVSDRFIWFWCFEFEIEDLTLSLALIESEIKKYEAIMLHIQNRIEALK